MKAPYAFAALASLWLAGSAHAFILESGCPPNATCAEVNAEIFGEDDRAVVYVALNNVGPEGTELGGKTVGNGSHLLDASGGYMMDCTENEAECRAALEAAKDSVSDGGDSGGGQTPGEPEKPEEPADPGQGAGAGGGQGGGQPGQPGGGNNDEQQAQVYTDGSAIYFIGGARLFYRQGKLIFVPGR